MNWTVPVTCDINKLHKKLNSASCLLKRISCSIPKEYYKSLYFGLFESPCLIVYICIWPCLPNTQ